MSLTTLFERKFMAVAMKSKSPVIITSQVVPIDNQLLFKRLPIATRMDQ